MKLRLITYLSPGLPLAIFEALAAHIERSIPGYEVVLHSEERVSGPERGAPEPFSSGDADVGFVCAPSYVWLKEREPPPARLLGVAPVFAEERNRGKPLYFCDVVVPRDLPADSFGDLKGRVWAYNDACSLSGYHGLLARFGSSGGPTRFFGRVLQSGSHMASIQSLFDGVADAASIDSNVLGIMMNRQPSLRERLRVIESWGPYPVQPVLIRSDLDPHLEEALRTSLLETEADPLTRRSLAAFGLTHFAPVGEDDYAPERLLPPAVF